MDLKKLEKSISLQCPTCGGDQFKYDGDPETAALFICASCQREIQRDDLLDENQALISNHVEQMGKEAVREVQKELRKSLQKAFSRSKNIKFK